MMNEQIFTSDFLNKLERLSVHVTTLMSHGGAGNRKSKAKGMSVEFSDYRKYVPSDDFRRIDWHAYGRFKKLYVKLFMEEKEAIIRLFIDNSKSMSYGGKDMMALRLAGAFSYLALNHLDKVLLNPLHAGEQNVFLGQGKHAFGHYMHYLEGISFQGASSRLDNIKRMHVQGSGLSIIISDFFIEDEMEDIVKYLRYNHQQVLLLHVLSEEELNPQLDGRLKLTDSETMDEKNLMMTPQLLRKYKLALEKFQHHLKDISYKYDAHYVCVNARDSIEKIILEELLGSFVRV